MANTYKNIVITPNIGNTSDPKIVFSGANTTTNTDITVYIYPDSNGTISFEGSAGQLFSITNDLSNNLFGIYDASGTSYSDVYANGLFTLVSGSTTANLSVGNATNAVAKLDISGNYAVNIVTVSANSVNCAAGNYYTKTISTAVTFTFDNPPSSRAYGFLIELTNGGSATVTWPTSVKWPGGTAPSLTASGVDLLGFVTDDGGTTWRAVASMLNSS